MVFGVDGPKQLLVNEVMDPCLLKSHIEKVRSQVRPLKQSMVEELNELGIWIAPTHPSTPILLAKGPDCFFQYLKQYQILSERGSDFRQTYPLDDAYVRLRIPADQDQVKKLLVRTEKLLNEALS